MAAGSARRERPSAWRRPRAGPASQEPRGRRQRPTSRERARLDELARRRLIGGALAEGGTERADAAGAAGRLASVADPPAMPDQAVRQDRPLRARKQRSDVPLDLLGILLGRPAESARQPAEVGIDGDARHAESVAEDYVGGLAADPRQRDQVAEPAGHLAAEPLAQRLAEADDAVGLGAEEPGGLDDLLQLGAVGGGI